MTETLDRLAVVRFMAGGWPFAVEAVQVRAMLGTGEDAVSAESLIGLPPGPASRRTRLAIGPDSRVVEVSEPVELAELPTDCLFPLPVLVAERMTLGGIRAVALIPSGPVLLVDLAEMGP